MGQNMEIECVGGLWNGRWVSTPVNEHGQLAPALNDDAGKPYYRLIFDRCIIDANNLHSYENPRFVPVVL